MSSSGQQGAQGDELGMKHDLWVVPYADMLTLLFAMFVVFYAVGRSKNQKLMMERLSRGYTGLAITDPGNGLGDQAPGDGATGKGEILDGLELTTSQSEPLKRFVAEHLPETFAEISGDSLIIDLTSDTWSFSTSLDAFFEPGGEEIRPAVRLWLLGLFSGELGGAVLANYAAFTRVRIMAPLEALPKRDRNGQAILNNVLCHRRLQEVEGLLARIPEVQLSSVESHFAWADRSAEHWEVAGRVTFAFSNQ